MDAIRPYLTYDNLMTAAAWLLVLLAAVSAWIAGRSAKSARKSKAEVRELYAQMVAEQKNIVAVLEREAARKTVAEQRAEERRDAAEQERKMEARKARVCARIERAGHVCWLIVEDHGPSQARNIRTYLEGVRIMDHWLFQGQPKKQTERYVLEPRGEPARYRFPPPGDDELLVRIEWDDDTGHDRSFEEPLAIPMP